MKKPLSPEEGLKPEVARDSMEQQQKNYALEFRNLLMPDPNFAETNRPKLDEAAKNIAATLTDPALARAVDLYRGAYDTALFGSGETAVPEGFILVSRQDSTSVMPDPSIPYMNRLVERHVRSKFHSQGMDDIRNERTSQLETHETDLEKLITDFWQHSSIYSFFKAFENPVPDKKESPLSPFWRQIREKQVEQDVRRRHGVDDRAAISRGSRAHHELVRALYHLDDEVQIQPELDKKTTGIQRARQYLTPFLNDAIRESKRFPEQAEFKVIASKQGSVFLKIEGGDPEGDYLSDFSGRVADKVVDENYMDSPSLRGIAQERLTVLTDLIFDPRQKSLGSALSQSLTDELDYAIEKILYTGGGPIDVDLSDDCLIDALLYDFKADRVVDYSSYEPMNLNNRAEWQDRGAFSLTAELVDQRVYERDRFATVAWVPRGTVDTRRLFFSGPSPDHDLPEVPDSDEDLFVRIEGQAVEWPFIPGYKLVSKPREGVFGLASDPEADPYVRCDIEIPREARNSLAEKYQGAGLVDLARSVMYRQGLTVSDLADLLKHNGHYIFPRSDSFGYGYDHPKDISSIDDIRSLVKNGILEVQCTGASQALRVSLEHVFGLGSSGIMTGYTIDPYEDRINGAGHAQTVFVHDGRYYLLDATPSFLDERSTTPSASSSGLTAPTMPPPLAFVHPDVTRKPEEKTELQLVEVKDPRVIDRQVAIDHLVETIAGYLKITFASSNDEQLYKRLVGLPSHDPVRRTFETLLRARKGSIDAETIDSATQYVSLVAQTDERDRGIVNAEDYDNALLRRLEQSLLELGYLYESEE